MNRISALQNALKWALISLLSACAPIGPMVSADSTGGRADSAISLNLELTPVSTDFRVPWGLATLPSGDLLVTERSGKLYRLSQDGQRNAVSGLPRVSAQGQGGLLDVAVHPAFAENQWVYFSYSKPLKGGRQTAIARAQLSDDKLHQWTDLYIGNYPSRAGQHFGSRIVLHDGYVFFSIGDRGNRDANPQDLRRDGGKVYRLHDDGRLPEDNPFVRVDGALPATWSYGHRNPQGMTFDTKTKKLWVHEHGPRGGDELNLIEPGKNYGWPLATFGVNYSGTRITDKQDLEGTVSPSWHWTPSIAPSGLTTVSRSKYPSLGDGLLAGSLKFGELHFRPNGENQPFRVVLDGLQRVRSLTTASDGTIYVGISNAGVFQLEDRTAH